MVARLVIAAPASGCGKTTVATGLMAALTARGMRVSPHKIGPDYIDPGYHALACGKPGRNLDPCLVGERLISPLFLHGAAGSDLAIIEGVMGLYDGADATGWASTAQVAALLDAPVVLVVDASGQGRSVAALVQGFAAFDPEVRLRGVILNRIGSDRHEHICREALSGISVLGAIRRTDAIATPSRHLGLIPAAERHKDALAAVDGMGALIATSCDLDGLVRLARSARPLPANPWEANPWEPSTREPSTREGAEARTVAVAGGPAFTFGYAEQAELLTAAGAEVATFDPLRDEALPAGTRGVIIGGGFPEMYAGELSANEPLRRQIGALARNGAPIAAECAGLLYLTNELDGRPMCGVIDAAGEMTTRLTLGYRQAVAASDSVLARTGERFHGHEFHRTTVQPGHGSTPAYQWTHSDKEGFVSGKTVASYLHLHWAGSPELARRFVEAC